MRLALPNKIIFVLLLIVTFSGCMEDDYADCPEDTTGVRITFRYDYNTEGTDRFATVVSNVELYIYDSEGLFIDLVEYNESQLQQTDYTVTVYPDPGLYTMVALMNRSDAYTVQGQEQFSTARIMRSITRSTPASADPEPVYHSLANIEIITGDEEINMSFTKNVNLITLDMIFEDPLPSDLEVESFIEGLHGVYDFRNLPVREEETEPLTYTPHKKETYNDYNILSGYTVDRMMTDDELELTIIQIKDGRTRPIEVLELVPLIMQNPDYNTQEKLDRNDTFPITVHLKFVETSLIVSEVYIDGWKVIKSNTGI